MNWPARSLGTLIEIVVIVVAVILAVLHLLSLEAALLITAVAAMKL